MSAPRPPGTGTTGPATAVDPDVDLHVPGQRREWTRHRWVLPVIALGGMAGASARYALEVAWASEPHEFPWATLLTNASGCLLIGLLMVQVVEVGRAHPLVRPFLGVGVLGGYTTFSTYAVQADALLREEEPVLALTYAVGTVVAALVAVTCGVFAARALVRLRQRSRRRHEDRGER